jgi:RHS repeat-associated protein
VAYDSLSHVTDLWDGKTNHTTWQYNEYGWLTNKLDALSRTAFRYAWNANGWLTNRWTPAKGDTAYTYDNIGNLRTTTYPNTPSLQYSYDALNRLTNLTDAADTTIFSYTPAGQLESESNAWAVVSYTYAQGLRTAMTLSQSGTNWTQSYGYDASWRMTNIVSPAGAFGYIFGGASSASALIKRLTLPNGAYITNRFDELARLQETALANHWGHVLDGYTYQFDPLGLRTNITRNLGLTSSSASIGYDNIGQITSWLAQESGGTARLNEQLGFGYDAANNLRYRTNGAFVQSFNTDGANELTGVERTGPFTLSGATPAPASSVTVNGHPAQTYGDFVFAATNLALANGTNTFTNIAVNAYGVRVTNTLAVNLPTNVALLYDLNGNLTNDGLRSFGYDVENQLTNVTVPGQYRSDFVYDGLGRRRIVRNFAWQGGQWVKTNEVRYLYDGYLAIQERDTNNSSLVTYTRGLDLSGTRQRAGGIGGLIARTDVNGSTFYHADALGNITALMDGSENIVARYLYGPFGKLTGQWGPMAELNHYRFSSKELDALSGLYYFGFRFYEPNSQRWPNHDPIGEGGGLNLYRFNYNSPPNYIDPDGKNPLLLLFLAGAAVGGVMTPYTANAPGPGDPTYPAVTGQEILGNALMGGLLNVGIGGAGMLTDGGIPAFRPTSCPVSRWGRPGLRPGDWVMEGDPNYWNYLMTGKWEPTPWNRTAPFGSGQTFNVPPDTINWPSGFNFYKGLPPFNQRIYVGPSVPPSSGSVVNAPPSSIQL